jgi:ligand-binding sensor domain-containing protein
MNLVNKYLLFISIFQLVISCNGQNEQKVKKLISQHNAKLKITEKIPLPENGFCCGYLDNENNLWFGTNGNGIYQFDGKVFRNFTQKDGLESDQVFTITSDQNSNIWLGTQTGLTRFDGEVFENISIPQQDTSSIWLDKVYPIINPNAVHSIIQDRKGSFWIGTGGGGAYHFDQKKFTSVLAKEGMKYEDSLYHNWIPDIAEDKNGIIWFASMSYGGLNRFDGKSFRTYLRKDGLSDDMIRKIFIDTEGKIWLGFNGNRKSALTVYNEGTFFTYSLENNSCHRNIRAIHEDKDSKLWLGGEEGICILYDHDFTEFLNADGLPYSGITFIVADKNRNVWFGGRKGLWKYDGTKTTELTK